MAGEEAGDRGSAGADAIHEEAAAEVPEPGFVGAVTEVEELRGSEEDALPELVGECVEVVGEGLVEAGDGAQFDGEGIRRREVGKAVEVSAQGVGKDEGVEAVVLGAGHRVAVAEAVELLGVDGEDLDGGVLEGFDNRAMGDLDSDSK